MQSNWKKQTITHDNLQKKNSDSETSGGCSSTGMPADFSGICANQPRRGSTTSSLPTVLDDSGIQKASSNGCPLPCQLQEQCQMCSEAAAVDIRSEDASNHIRFREHIFKLSLPASGVTAIRIYCWEQKRSVLQGVFFEIEFRLIDGSRLQIHRNKPNS